MTAARSLVARAMAALRAGRREEARRAVRAAIAAAPADVDALHLGAMIAHEDGKGAEALRLIDRALARAPDDAGLHRARGVIAHALGRREESIAAFRAAHRGDPGDLEVARMLARLLVEAGAEADAAAILAAGAQATGDPEIAFEFGNALREIGRFDAAETAYARARSLAPRDVRILSNHALVLARLGRRDAAGETFRAALALEVPAKDGARLANAYASFLKDGDDREGARQYFETAVTLDPDQHAYRLNLAEVSVLDGNQAWHLASALAGRPELDARLPLDTYEPLAMSLLYVDPTGLRQRDLLARAHRARLAALPPPAPHANPRDPQRRLRVGYLSPDLRRHAVACFALPLIEAHDPARVELFAYAEIERADDVTARFRARCTGWTDTVALDDDALAGRIRADGIDILVDLAGLTGHNRHGALRRRPAPVQLTWIGYPATTGLDCFDARITDAIADPPGMTEAQFVEPLARLDRCFLAYRPLDPLPAPSPPPARDHVVFGSFNYVAKISAANWRLWARVLAAVSGSRLRIKSAGIERAMVIRDLRQRAAAAGIAPGRIDFVTFTADAAAHFAAYGDIDVALDTFPYNGTTTTCEALWMGVPVVTLAGRTHHSRVGTSLLRHAALGDLVAEDEAAYVRLAAALAADRDRRTRWRAELRAQVAASQIGDGPGLARGVERLFGQLWLDWCARAP